MTVHALKARYVFPVSGKPIAEGMVGIQGERIAAVGKQVAADTLEDLGNAAIMPGLVNAHTHLEFSDLTKPLGRPGIGFVEWIRLIRREIPEFRIHAVKKGFDECAKCGVTAIGEITQSDLPMPAIEKVTADCTAFFELIAPTVDRVSDALAFAVGCVKRTSEATPGWQLGLSPHAPYSVHLDLMHKII